MQSTNCDDTHRGSNFGVMSGVIIIDAPDLVLLAGVCSVVVSPGCWRDLLSTLDSHRQHFSSAHPMISYKTAPSVKVEAM